ncbi:unnamed protein product [Rotaria magnacalcarata]
MWILYIVLFTLPISFGARRDFFEREDYDAFGERLAIIENRAIFAENDARQFTIIENPFSSNPLACNLDYMSIDPERQANISLGYVYNIVMGSKQDKMESIVAMIGESKQKKFYLIVMIMAYSSGCIIRLKHAIWVPVSFYEYYPPSALATDPRGTFICVVQLDSTLCVDTISNTTTTFSNDQFWDEKQFFYSKSLAITEKRRLLLTAYRIIDEEKKFIPSLYLADLSDPSNPLLLGMKNLSSQYLKQERDVFTRSATLSLFLHENSNMVIVGVPHLDCILIFSMEQSSLSLVKTHVSPEKNVLFGKSVAIMDSNIYAVLVYALATLPWSLSQIQVYSLNETVEMPKPLFIFPNNQQEMELADSQELPHRIVSLVTWYSNGIGLVLDAASVLLIPASPPGYCSASIKKYEDIEIYKPKLCIPGTRQISSSFGPCMICPPGYKNNGSAGELCVKCKTNDTFWCFGAAINEIDMKNMTSYNQANPYPESPHTTEFEDILLQNIFQFSTLNLHCLRISPMFWTSVGICCCILFCIIIKIISCWSKSRKRQQCVQKILSHCDVIGDGKYWLGGLISLLILILITFACKFSISFTYLYPIEQTSLEQRRTVSCDNTLFNAKLTSSLQLLSTLKYEEEKPIFTLLNGQQLILTVQFISTGYTCKDLELQTIRAHGLSIKSETFNCSKSNEVLTIIKLLPQHVLNMQIILKGPHFIGGLRFCFSAASVTNSDAHSKAQAIDTCQLFFMPNQTLTRNPTVNVKMTKAINRTAGFTLPNETRYTGLWLPRFTADTLTDELLFSLGSEYLRYALKTTILVISITESEFYMKNTQEPIARQYEILFSTILFASKIALVLNE